VEVIEVWSSVMRIVIFTQNEKLYLPKAFATVCDMLHGDVVCVIAAPAMSTHGGAVRGFIRHFRCFGFLTTLRMGLRVVRSELLDRVIRPGREGPFFSVEDVARAYTIPFHSVKKIASKELYNLVDKYHADILVSISCPQIIGKKIRDRFSRGCLNVHGAPLPRYRGLMPAFWVLRNGETVTATSVHDLGDKLDNGDILVQREVQISPSDTWDSLVRKTKAEGALALVDAVKQIKAGTVQRRPNLDEDATYFSFPKAEDRKEFLSRGRRFL